IRLAQMIYDKNDPDFEAKVQQLMEVAGKTQDECLVALHDCNGDVNRAILFLLDSPSDTNSWETVGGKKKSPGKDGSAPDTKEKKGEREPSRGRGASNRRGRGLSRGREGSPLTYWTKAWSLLVNDLTWSCPSGPWGGNMEDWTSEDWSEDVRSFSFKIMHLKN
uniref:UBA domain-containing protein n=1 Tax=Periophthalmus magnuspinnatus TaxID=409849 RepID=A0A3B3Z7V2_9GOBI